MSASVEEPVEAMQVVDEEQEQQQQHEAGEEKQEKLTKFPLATIKRIMKMDPDVNVASNEAALLVRYKSSEIHFCIRII